MFVSVRTIVRTSRLRAAPALSTSHAHPLYMDALGYRVTAHPVGSSVTDDLELLIAEVALHQAHHYQCSLAVATRQIRGLVDRAREEYRARGAPCDDDDQGFCRWLLAKPRLTPSA